MRIRGLTDVGRHRQAPRRAGEERGRASARARSAPPSPHRTHPLARPTERDMRQRAATCGCEKRGRRGREGTVRDAAAQQ